MKNIYKIFACCSLTVLLIFSAGCSTISPGSDSEELVPISSIGVLPAQTANVQQTESGTIDELNAGVETVNSIFSDYFKAYQDVSLISQSKLEGLSSANSGKPFS